MRSSDRVPLSLSARLMWREIRGSKRRFLFFVLCLAVGVTAIVSVAGLTENLDRRIRQEARQVLAADLVVSGLQPPSAEIEEYLADRPDLGVTRIRELVTMAYRPTGPGDGGASQLVELKVVDGPYPFYGTLQTDPDADLQDLLAGDRIVAAPDLLARLDLSRESELKIGGHGFRLSALLLREPDRVASPFSLGPRVLMSGDGFARAGLEQMGSRIVYRVLVRLPRDYEPRLLSKLAEEIRQIAGEAGPYRVRTYLESQEELQGALRRAASFLGLVALLSLLLGGLGIAQTTRAWLASRTDDVAIMRCLGLRPAEVLGLFMGQALLMAVLGSALGVVSGVIVQSVVPMLFSHLLGDMKPLLWQPEVFLKGMALGVGVALIFSFRALLSLQAVPPLRVLRKDVEPLPRSRWLNLLILAVLAGGIWSVAAIQAASILRGLLFVLGLALASLLLAAVALILMRSFAPLARKLSRLWLRQGLLSLSRPGAATLGAIVSLGIGVLLILGLELVRDRLSNRLEHELPADAPTAFLINIQPRQWSEIESLLREQGANRIRSVPVVTARLQAIDDRSAAELAADEREGDRRWALTREQRLTYMAELPPDNKILSGQLWSLPGQAEVSVEEEFARNLEVEVGSRLRFDLQGFPLELEVSSLRSVEWTSFGINFYLVVEPGVLEDAPHQRVATARLPPEREQTIQDLLAEAFPNVTLLKIREILEQLAIVFGYLARGVSFIGAFTAIAGILILAGGISADSVRRRQHIALLKTLGMTPSGIAAMLAVEFAVIGLVTAVIGVVGGNLLAWSVLTRGLELDWQWQPATLATAIALTLALTTATGILSSRRASSQPPAVVLRGE